MSNKAAISHKLYAQKIALGIDFSQWMGMLCEPETYFATIKKCEGAVVKDILAIEKTMGDVLSGDYDALET